MKYRLKRWGVAACAVVLGWSLAACGGFNDDRGVGDSGVNQQRDVDIPVWPSPDQFSNIAARCIGENGIYWTTAEVPVVVVVSDPNCKPGGILDGTST